MNTANIAQSYFVVLHYFRNNTITLRIFPSDFTDNEPKPLQQKIHKKYSVLFMIKLSNEDISSSVLSVCMEIQ